MTNSTGTRGLYYSGNVRLEPVCKTVACAEIQVKRLLLVAPMCIEMYGKSTLLFESKQYRFMITHDCNDDDMLL